MSPGRVELDLALHRVHYEFQEGQAYADAVVVHVLRLGEPGEHVEHGVGHGVAQPATVVLNHQLHFVPVLRDEVGEADADYTRLGVLQGVEDQDENQLLKAVLVDGDLLGEEVVDRHLDPDALELGLVPEIGHHFGENLFGQTHRLGELDLVELGVAQVVQVLDLLLQTGDGLKAKIHIVHKLLVDELLLKQVERGFDRVQGGVEFVGQGPVEKGEHLLP